MEALPRSLVAAVVSCLPLVAAACHEGGESDPCTGVDCSGRGTCVTEGSAPICMCFEGYHAEGLRCVEDGSGDGDADSDSDSDVDGDGDADSDVDGDDDVDEEADGDEEAPEPPVLGDVLEVGAGQDARAVAAWPHGVLVDYIADQEDPSLAADDRDVVHFALIDADAGSVLGRTSHDPAPGLDGVIGECDGWASCGVSSGRAWALFWHETDPSVTGRSIVLLAVSADGAGTLGATDVTTALLGAEAPNNRDVTIVGDSDGCVLLWRHEEGPSGAVVQSFVARRTTAPGVLDPAWPTEPVEVMVEGDARGAVFDSVRSDPAEQVRPFAAADGDGGVIVAVPARLGSLTAPPVLLGQRLDRTGTRLWSDGSTPHRILFDAARVTGTAINGIVQTDTHPITRLGGAAPFLVTGTTEADERCVFYGGPDIRAGSGPIPTAPVVPCDPNTWDADVIAVAGLAEPFAAGVYWEWGGGFEPPSWSHALVLSGSHLGSEWTSPVLDALPALVAETRGTILLRTFHGDMATSFDIVLTRLGPTLEVEPGWPAAGVVVRERGPAFSLPTDVPDTPLPIETPEGGAVQVFTEQSSSTDRYFVRARALLPPSDL